MGVETLGLGAVEEIFCDDIASSWFLLRTRSRHEKIVANDLSSRGIMHFLPLMRCTRYYGQRKVQVELPLFPGYVFLRGAAEDAYASDRAGRLAQIIEIADQSQINDELKNIAVAMQNDAELTAYPYLHKGVSVEVRSGPFRGLRGVVEDWGKRNRLILKVDILGRAVSLEVDPALLDVI